MFTNTEKFGGNFKSALKQEFKTSKNIVVASGYASADILLEFKNEFIKISKNGGSAKLLLGMAFYEGLSQTKLDILHTFTYFELNDKNYMVKQNNRIYSFT